AVQVTLSVGEGTLTLSGTTGLSFTSGDGSSDAAMIFSGTLANINAALNGLFYAPGLNFNGLATLTISSSDLGNFGLGTPLSDTDTVAITVNAVNDAPVAVDDEATTNEDTPVTIAVLANDEDVDNDE